MSLFAFLSVSAGIQVASQSGSVNSILTFAQPVDVCTQTLSSATVVSSVALYGAVWLMLYTSSVSGWITCNNPRIMHEVS